MTQKPLLSLFNASAKVREHLYLALESGRKVSAKVRFGRRSSDKSNKCWMHCTPLLDAEQIRVWVIILIDVPPEMASRESQGTLASTKARIGAKHDLTAIERENEMPSGFERTLVHGVGARNGSDASSAPHVHRDSRIKAVSTTSSRSMKESSSDQDSVKKAENKDRTAGTQHRSRSQSRNDSFPQSRPGAAVATRPPFNISASSSLDGSVSDKAPINVPGDTPSFRGNSGYVPPRKTYKSLSPYGILFPDN